MNDVICVRQPWQLVILFIFVWGMVTGIFYRLAFEKLKELYTLIICLLLYSLDKQTDIAYIEDILNF